jgi:hypothetical protein
LSEENAQVVSERTGYYFDLIAWRNSSKVRLMNFETRAVYRDVLDEIWLVGSVPKDPQVVAQLCHIPLDVMTRAWPVIERALIPTSDPNLLTSERMELERKKRDTIKAERSFYSRLKGKTNAEKERLLADRAQGDLKLTLSSPIQEQEQEQDQVQGKKKKRKTRSADAEAYSHEFENFWREYPKKKGKRETFIMWKQLKPNAELQQRMLKALAWQKTSHNWTKDDGQFIPDPVRWLKRGQWDDEPPKKSSNRPLPMF